MIRCAFTICSLLSLYTAGSNGVYLPERAGPMEKIEQEYLSDTAAGSYLGASQGVFAIPSTAEIIAAEALAPGLLPNHLKYTTGKSDEDDYRLSRRVRNSNEDRRDEKKADSSSNSDAQKEGPADGTMATTTEVVTSNAAPTMATTSSTTKYEFTPGYNQDQIARPGVNWQAHAPADQQTPRAALPASRMNPVPYSYNQQRNALYYHQPSGAHYPDTRPGQQQYQHGRHNTPRHPHHGVDIPAYKVANRPGSYQPNLPRPSHSIKPHMMAHHKLPSYNSKNIPSYSYEAAVLKNQQYQDQPVKRSVTAAGQVQAAEDRQMDPYGADMGMVDPGAMGMAVDPNMYYEPSAAAPRATDTYSNPNVGPGCVTYEMAHQPDPCQQAYGAPVATSAL